MGNLNIQDRLNSRISSRDLGTIAREQHDGRPMVELAPWLFPIRDDLIVNKDAALMSCYEFTGLDTDGASKADMASLAMSMNKLLTHQQEEPLMLWWTVQRTRTTDYPVSQFPDPISQSVDDAMKAMFLAGRNFVNRHYLSTVLQANTGMLRFQERISHAVSRGQPILSALTDAVKTVFDDQRVFAYTPPELQETAEKSERIATELTGSLPDLKFRRLRGDDLGAFLHGMVSPATADQQKVALPGLYGEDGDEPHPLDMPPLLDEALTEGSVDPGRDFLCFTAGGKQKFAVGVTIKKIDAERIGVGALDRLCSVPGELTISYALRLIPKSQAEQTAERMRNYHEDKKHSWKAVAKAVSNKGDFSNSPVNPGRERLAKEANRALGEFTRDAKCGLYLYLSVICYGDTLEEADQTAEHVEQVLRHAHLVPDREEQHLLSAWATTIPGMWKECARWKFFNSKAFSMIAPIHTISRGQTENSYFTEQTNNYSPALAVLPTDYDTPFYFSTHMGDLGHGFLAGPSRAGKSVLANLLAMLFRRYPDAQIIFFDKDYSSRIPILLQGGTYLDFSSDIASKRFNPMAWLDDGNLEFTMNWVELLLSQRGYQMDADDAKDLEASLRSTISLKNDPTMKRMATVYSQLSRDRLKKELEGWVGSRVDAKYFDNEEDGFDLADRLLGVEVGKLLTNERVAIPAMEYCFERIDSMLRKQREEGIVRPTFIYLAEVWHLLKREHYQDKINDWLKTLAKRCACVWMDTQSVEDFIASGIFASLRDNIPNRIFLPNKNARSASLRQMYRREFELTDNQIDRIAQGVRKQDYLFQQGDISRTVKLRLPDALLARLRSDMAAQIVFDKHFQSGQPNWIENYLQEVQAV